jgi:hypothetical protein
MGRLSLPSKRAHRRSSSSGKRSAAGQKQEGHLYCSRWVAGILDKVIAKETEIVAKNPNTVSFYICMINYFYLFLLTIPRCQSGCRRWGLVFYVKYPLPLNIHSSNYVYTHLICCFEELNLDLYLFLFSCVCFTIS